MTERIGELAKEEHALFEEESGGAATDEDRERLKRLEVTAGPVLGPPAATSRAQKCRA